MKNFLIYLGGALLIIGGVVFGFAGFVYSIVTACVAYGPLGGLTALVLYASVAFAIFATIDDYERGDK